jgi:hypothetical protein
MLSVRLDLIPVNFSPARININICKLLERFASGKNPANQPEEQNNRHSKVRLEEVRCCANLAVVSNWVECSVEL